MDRYMYICMDVYFNMCAYIESMHLYMFLRSYQDRYRLATTNIHQSDHQEVRRQWTVMVTLIVVPHWETKSPAP